LCQSNWSPPGVTTAAVSAAAGSETLARRDTARARARTLFGAHQAFRKPFGVRRDERGVPRTACARGDAIGRAAMLLPVRAACAVRATGGGGWARDEALE
jgi:hypothetical protein